MTLSVLIVSPSTGFGDLLKQAFNEAGGYSVALARTGAEAVECSRRGEFHLAILDSDLRDLTVDQLGRILLDLLPGLRVIQVSPAKGGLPIPVKSFQPNGFLSKPFYMPDLFSVVAEALEGSPINAAQPPRSVRKEEATSQTLPLKAVQTRIQPPEAGPVGGAPPLAATPLPWLQDVRRAAQLLTRLSLEVAAQAALITRAGELWAYAGQLPRQAAVELSQAVVSDRAHSSQLSARGSSSDLARFVHLQSTGDEYMLYSTSLGNDMALALVFEAETPLSQMRAQASSLARALASPPPEPSRPQPATASTPLPSEIDLEEDDEYLDEEDEEGEIEMPPFLPLDLVPPPTPRPSSSLPRGTSTDEDENWEPGSLEEPIWLPADEAAQDDFDQNLPPGFLWPDSPRTGAREGNVSLDLPLFEPADVPLQPTAQALYSLQYACVLVPRLPSHHLTGSLAVKLGEWLRTLSTAFEWQLGHLAVRPDYLCWVHHIPPDTSPSQVVSAIRRHTSQRIFAQFPALAEENPSGDYWASSYLVVASPKPPPASVLHEFVQNARSRQVIYHRNEVSEE